MSKLKNTTIIIEQSNNYGSQMLWDQVDLIESVTSHRYKGKSMQDLQKFVQKYSYDVENELYLKEMFA